MHGQPDDEAHGLGIRRKARLKLTTRGRPSADEERRQPELTWPENATSIVERVRQAAGVPWNCVEYSRSGKKRRKPDEYSITTRRYVWNSSGERVQGGVMAMPMKEAGSKLAGEGTHAKLLRTNTRPGRGG